MNTPADQSDHPQLLHEVLMRAAANRAAAIRRQSTASLLREIKSSNARTLKGQSSAGKL